MKKGFLFAFALLLSVGTASAATTQRWTDGWDNFGEPLDRAKSSVAMSRPELPLPRSWIASGRIVIFSRLNRHSGFQVERAGAF